MGPYSQKSILLALTSEARELNAAEDVRLPAGEGEIFTERQKLSKVDEDEIAGRALIGIRR